MRVLYGQSVRKMRMHSEVENEDGGRALPNREVVGIDTGRRGMKIVKFTDEQMTHLAKMLSRAQITGAEAFEFVGIVGQLKAAKDEPVQKTGAAESQEG